jgi:hypothetical protein
VVQSTSLRSGRCLEDITLLVKDWIHDVVLVAILVPITQMEKTAARQISIAWPQRRSAIHDCSNGEQGIRQFGS